MRIYLLDQDAVTLVNLLTAHPGVFHDVPSKAITQSALTSFTQQMIAETAQLLQELKPDTKDRMKTIVATGYHHCIQPADAQAILQRAENRPDLLAIIQPLLDGPSDIRIESCSLMTFRELLEGAPTELYNEFFEILENSASVYLTEGDQKVVFKHIDSIMYVPGTPYLPQMAQAANMRRRLKRDAGQTVPVLSKFKPEPAPLIVSFHPRVGENCLKTD